MYISNTPKTPRTGATAVEAAIIYPVYFLFVIGLIVGCLGVFRYQQLSNISREAARWACVRGEKYSFATGQPAATPQDVYDNVIEPKATLLDPTKLTYTVTWNPDNRQDSMVTVSLEYEWLPELYFSPVTLRASSTVPVQY